jgi:putative redox protein
MPEHVIVQQNSDFEIAFLAADPEAEEGAEGDEPEPVYHVHELTPYGMMLASLGSCTTIVLHTYAQHHDVALDDVEIDLRYQRIFAEDCEDCTNIDRYEERIEQEIKFRGDLTEGERKRLFHVSKQCSIHKMFESGIKIESRLLSG